MVRVSSHQIPDIMSKRLLYLLFILVQLPPVLAQTEKNLRKESDNSMPVIEGKQEEAQYFSALPVMEQVYQKQTTTWYQNQKQIWGQKAAGHQKDADAWLNYYKAARYAGADQQELNDLIQQMSVVIPGTFEYHYARYLNSNRDLSYAKDLLNAYMLQPNRTELYKEIALYFTWSGDQENLEKILKKWKSAGEIPDALNQYAHNLLATPSVNALLITDGEYDTYPLWIMQQVDKYRTDVKVLNISLLDKTQYRTDILKKYGLSCSYAGNNHAKIIQTLLHENPSATFYFSFTINTSTLQSIQSNLYNEGLAYRYAKDKYNSLSRLEQNWEKQFELSYLDAKIKGSKIFTQQKMQALYLNYVASGLELYDYYMTKSEKDKATRLLQRLRGLAAQQSKESLIEQYIKP